MGSSFERKKKAYYVNIKRYKWVYVWEVLTAYMNAKKEGKRLVAHIKREANKVFSIKIDKDAIEDRKLF